MKEDYIGKFGCCLVCKERYGCVEPCNNCRCSKCDWYIETPMNPYYRETHKRCHYNALKNEKVAWGELRIVKKTTKAIQIRDPTSRVGVWLPRSLIKIMTVEAGLATIEIPNWLADEKGLDTEGISELHGLTFSEFEEEYMSERFDCRGL